MPSSLSEAQFIRRVLIAAGISIAMLTLAVFLWYAVYVIFLIFAGVLLAILLSSLAELVSTKTRLSDRWSLAIVLVVLLGGAGLLFWLMGKSVFLQVNELADKLPQSIESFKARISSTAIGKKLVEGAPSGEQIIRGGGFGRMSGILTSTFDAMAALVVIGFVGIFLAFDPKLYVRGALHLAPERHRKRMADVLGSIGFTLKWWLIGQAITMVVITLATWLGLQLLGVPLALVLGILAGLLNFIPNFGPLIAAVPACLLAMVDDPQKAIWVIVLFLVLQNLEGNVLTPMIQSRAVALPPALTIISQLLLGILVGFVGLALATPMAAGVLVAVKMLYVEDAIGEEMPTPDDRPKKEVQKAREVAREIKEDGNSAKT